MNFILHAAVLATTLASVTPSDASICTHLKATDTLIFHGHKQHAERFVECIVGRWPNVDSVFRAAPSRTRGQSCRLIKDLATVFNGSLPPS